MSFINSYVTMPFGGGRSTTGPAMSAQKSNQAIAETLAATTRRKVHAPQRGGHYSLHVIVDSVNAPASATGLTVW